MVWPWEIVERDHDIQNPTSPSKIQLLGGYLRLSSDSLVLDIACGKGGPASILPPPTGAASWASRSDRSSPRKRGGAPPLTGSSR
jgi:hypothetical protein